MRSLKAEDIHELIDKTHNLIFSTLTYPQETKNKTAIYWPTFIEFQKN